MNNKIIFEIFFVLVIIYIIFKQYKSKKIEKMSNTNDDEIKKNINKYYIANFSSMKNLEQIVDKLYINNVPEIPSDINLSGNFNMLPKGVIIPFQGTQPPKGWALCDGKNGTPDLRGRFIFGSNNKYKIGNKGGEKAHKLTLAEMPSHSHRCNASGAHDHKLNFYNDDYNNKGKLGVNSLLKTLNCKRFRFSPQSHSHNHYINNTGANHSHNNMPPYHVLTWIIKL